MSKAQDQSTCPKQRQPYRQPPTLLPFLAMLAVFVAFGWLLLG